MSLRRSIRQLKKDIRLVRKTPKPLFSAGPNEEYWAARKKDHRSQMNEFQRDRAHWIAANANTPGGTLLDIGSGNGEMLMHFRSEGFDCTASDFATISQTRLRELGFPIVDVDLRDIDMISRLPEYDYIVMCEILEHIPDPEAALKAVLSRARKAVFFSVPNCGYYPYRLRLLGGRFPVQWRAHPGEHVRFWTLQDMRWWLRELGLEDRSSLAWYQGWPALSYLSPNLFSAGLIVRIDVSAQ